jgi:hypothetical protein
MWTSEGPNRPYDEIVNGSIGALPPEQGADQAFGDPNEEMVNFIRALCKYLRLT